MKTKYWTVLIIALFIIGSIVLAQRGCNYLTYWTMHECWCNDENGSFQGFYSHSCYDCDYLCGMIKE